MQVLMWHVLYYSNDIGCFLKTRVLEKIEFGIGDPGVQESRGAGVRKAKVHKVGNKVGAEGKIGQSSAEE